MTDEEKHIELDDTARRDKWLHDWKVENENRIVMMGLLCMRKLAHDMADAEQAHVQKKEAAKRSKLREALDDVIRIAPCTCPGTRPGTCRRCKARSLLSSTGDGDS